MGLQVTAYPRCYVFPYRHSLREESKDFVLSAYYQEYPQAWQDTSLPPPPDPRGNGKGVGEVAIVPHREHSWKRQPSFHLSYTAYATFRNQLAQFSGVSSFKLLSWRDPFWDLCNMDDTYGFFSEACTTRIKTDFDWFAGRHELISETDPSMFNVKYKEFHKVFSWASDRGGIVRFS